MNIKNNSFFVMTFIFCVAPFLCSAITDLVVVTSINRYYIADNSWTNDKYWDGRPGGVIQLLYDTQLSNVWTFSGTNILNMQQQVLDLSAGGQLVVESGSTLRISNMRINGLSGTNLRCKDASSRLVLDQCDLVFSGDYTFTTGGLIINHDVTMRGGKSFAYQSNNNFDINSYSSLSFSKNMTFSYNPANSNNQLVRCVDQTSELNFENASLYVGPGGLQLTCGELEFNGRCAINGASQGSLMLGNSFTTSDMAVVLSGNSVLTLGSGCLMYKNSDPSCWSNQSYANRLVIASGATLAVYNSLNFGQAMIQCQENATISWRSGAQLNASLHPLGRFNWINNL